MPHLTKAEKAAKISATEARRRKEVALAEIRELELQQLRHELILIKDVKTTWVTTAGKLRDAVMRIPVKCARLVQDASDAREVEAILRTECEGILRTLHDELFPNT